MIFNWKVVSRREAFKTSILPAAVGITTAKGTTLVPEDNPQSEPGPNCDKGPVDGAYPDLAALKAAPSTNISYRLVTASSAVSYFYETANSPYTADDDNVVKLDGVSLSVGALIKQKAESVSVNPHADAVDRTVQVKFQEYLSITDFGVPANAADMTANTTKMQAAVDAAIASKKSLFLPGDSTNYAFNSAIRIANNLKIFGEGRGKSRLLFSGSDGFDISAGVSYFDAQDFNIAQDIRYTTAPNTYTAIKVNGTGSSPCTNHRYTRLFIDGFQYGIEADNIWSSSFDVETVYTFGSIWLKEKSVNNTVLGSTKLACNKSLLTAAISDSFGVRIGNGTAPSPEGCHIQGGTVIFGVDRGIWNHGGLAVTTGDGIILDGIGEYGVIEQSSDTALAIMNDYSGMYIGISGTGGIGVLLSSTTTGYRNDELGTSICRNRIYIYDNATIIYGVLVEGSFQQNVQVKDNRPMQGRDGAGTLILPVVRDLRIANGRNHQVTGNAWSTTVGTDISSADTLYDNNSGRLAVGHDNIFRMEGDNKIRYGTATPSSGTHAVGDKTINRTPSIDGNNMVLDHWVCTVAGTPGTHAAQYFSTTSFAT